MFIRFAWNKIYVVKLTETNKTERFTLRWVFIVQSHVHLPVRGLQNVSASIACQLQRASVAVHRVIHLRKIGVSRCTTTDAPCYRGRNTLESSNKLVYMRLDYKHSSCTEHTVHGLLRHNTMQSGQHRRLGRRTYLPRFQDIYREQGCSMSHRKSGSHLQTTRRFNVHHTDSDVFLRSVHIHLPDYTVS
jgi:hypothetical protein